MIGFRYACKPTNPVVKTRSEETYGNWLSFLSIQDVREGKKRLKSINFPICAYWWLVTQRFIRHRSRIERALIIYNGFFWGFSYEYMAWIISNLWSFIRYWFIMLVMMDRGLIYSHSLQWCPHPKGLCRWNKFFTVSSFVNLHSNHHRSMSSLALLLRCSHISYAHITFSKHETKISSHRDSFRFRNHTF